MRWQTPDCERSSTRGRSAEAGFRRVAWYYQEHLIWLAAFRAFAFGSAYVVYANMGDWVAIESTTVMISLFIAAFFFAIARLGFMAIENTELYEEVVLSSRRARQSEDCGSSYVALDASMSDTARDQMRWRSLRVVVWGLVVVMPVWYQSAEGAGLLECIVVFFSVEQFSESILGLLLIMYYRPSRLIL